MRNGCLFLFLCYGSYLCVLFALCLPAQPRSVDVILEHLVGKFDQLLRGAVDFTKEPAFDHTRAGDHVNMCHQRNVILRDASLHCTDFVSDLLDRPVDDSVDIRLKKAFEMVAANGVQRAGAHRLIFLYIMKQLQQALLPEKRSLVLLEQGDRLLLKHPAQQIIDIRKMVIEILPPDAAALGQVVNRDLVDGVCTISSLSATASACFV